jgi:outer membrane protein OmpA-like peptidoglycan-associated protein
MLPRLLVVAALFAIGAMAGTAVGVPTVPLCAGLTIVTAIDEPNGDYESVKRITAVSDTAIDISVNGDRPLNGNIRRINVHRSVLRADLRTATFYLHHFDTRAPVTVPGSTAIGTSAAVLNALKVAGTAQLSIVDASARAAKPEDMRRSLYAYDLRRTAMRPVPVIVNGARTELPAVEAGGSNMGDAAEFAFLDDERNPLTLRYRFANGPADDEASRLQVVQISYRCDPAAANAEAPPSRLERALAEQGRADVYEIYFEFNSDRIREESEPTLREIAAVLKRHADWKLGIEGHTDSVASDAYNLELSKRRAAAVKDALVSRYAVGAVRLSTAGYGETRPKDRNDTLEGRARNRRVELVRQ